MLNSYGADIKKNKLTKVQKNTKLITVTVNNNNNDDISRALKMGQSGSIKTGVTMECLC